MFHFINFIASNFILVKVNEEESQTLFQISSNSRLNDQDLRIFRRERGLSRPFANMRNDKNRDVNNKICFASVFFYQRRETNFRTNLLESENL